MSDRYHAVAKWLHWLMALAIIFMLPLGWIMGNDAFVTGPDRFALYQLHKSLGISILVLAFMRLGWRLTHKPPPYPDTMQVWEKLAAKISHWVFYVLIIALPLSGWLMASASPYKTMLFGLLPLPNLPFIADLPNRKEVGTFFYETHEMLALIMTGLLVIHVGAALRHHFINKDAVLLRMMPEALRPWLLKLRKTP